MSSVTSNTHVSKPNLPVRDLQSFFLLLSELCVLSLMILGAANFCFPPCPQLPLSCLSLQQSL